MGDLLEEVRMDRSILPSFLKLFLISDDNE
jgi:hypothetical protein